MTRHLRNPSSFILYRKSRYQRGQFRPKRRKGYVVRYRDARTGRFAKLDRREYQRYEVYAIKLEATPAERAAEVEAKAADKAATKHKAKSPPAAGGWMSARQFITARVKELKKASGDSEIMKAKYAEKSPIPYRWAHAPTMNFNDYRLLETSGGVTWWLLLAVHDDEYNVRLMIVLQRMLMLDDVSPQDLLDQMWSFQSRGDDYAKSHADLWRATKSPQLRDIKFLGVVGFHIWDPERWQKSKKKHKRRR